jgi:hypothetical protein
MQTRCNQCNKPFPAGLNYCNWCDPVPSNALLSHSRTCPKCDRPISAEGDCPDCSSQTEAPSELEPLSCDDQSFRQFKTLWPSSRLLSFFAFLVWLSSLALTGIVLYAGQKRLSGLEILASGWLGPLVGNFAWFANVFFIVGVRRLWSSRTAIIPSLIAVLLSLDAFRFTSYLLNEGGATTPVYGYGWGAVLWFLSVSLLLAASGTFQAERLPASARGISTASFRQIGFALLASVVVSATWLSISDRKSPSVVESRRLEGIAFKRGKICKANDPLINEPIKEFSGTLKLEVSKNAIHANYPFNQVKELLKWGVAVVRVGETDYSLSSPGYEDETIGVPVKSAAGAVLSVDEQHSEGETRISAKLSELPSGRILFDTVWNSEAGGARYCPDYHSFPSENDQPRKFITQALNLSQVDGSTNQRHPRPVDNRVNAILIRRSDGGETRKIKTERWMASHPGQGSFLPMHEVFNTNCPIEIGWKGGGPDSNAVRLDMGWPFMVGDKAYHLGRRDMYYATCAGNHAFLYSGVAREGIYYLTIEKRILDGFCLQWIEMVILNDPLIATRDHAVKIEAIEEADDHINISVVNEDSGQMALFRAPLLRATKK